MINRQELEAEREKLKAELEAEYWAFTRQARARPPSPAKHRRLCEIEEALGIWRKPTRPSPLESTSNSPFLT